MICPSCGAPNRSEARCCDACGSQLTAGLAIEPNSGTVEKFIGDAVMAVFGIPQVHEDDAFRAVRAAQEIRDTVAIDVRVGLNTGEVVTGASGTLFRAEAAGARPA